MPYVLDPQVAGELGARSVLDTSTHPPLVSRVDYELDQPSTDDLIQSFPVFLVTTELGGRLQDAGLVGFTLANAEVRPGEEYLAEYGRSPHADYRWLQVEGTERDDCWIDSSWMLCVSERMMEVLKTFVVSECDVTPLGPS